MINIEKGNLIIAKPTVVNDNIFNRSVILLSEHNKNETVGFILNKKIDLKISKLLPNIKIDFDLYFGGPVETDSIFFIYSNKKKVNENLKINNYFSWGGEINQIVELVNKKKISKDEIKFFLGYSGWSKKQLFNEIKSNSWILKTEYNSNIINSNPKHLWRNILNSIGGEFFLWSNSPIDPKLN
tara:strand:- start:1285 stop:1836 length:552 start_codon:yes stop_codon:yes gene_type:complete